MAALLLWGRRRWPLGVTALVFPAAAIAPMAAGGGPGRHLHRGFAPGIVHRPCRRRRLSGPDVPVHGTVPGPEPCPGGRSGDGPAAGPGGPRLGPAAPLPPDPRGLPRPAGRAGGSGNRRLGWPKPGRAERVRIAGEMHDALAHRLSMLSLQAGAVELRPEAGPEELSAAAAVVRSAAHLALDDLRRVIGVLRHPGDGPAPLLAEADLEKLIEECRRAGMQIDHHPYLPGSRLPGRAGTPTSTASSRRASRTPASMRPASRWRCGWRPPATASRCR